MSVETRVGISGWRYKPWKGDFYPAKLSAKEELHFVSQNLNTVEINGSFYALQSAKNYKKWYEDTEKNFLFSIKGSRYITHVRRLKDIQTPLANFFASGVLELREKLGPFLWQFPPSMKWDKERFEEFFALLPKNTHEVSKLAKKHDSITSGKARLTPYCERDLRHAIEVRNESFNNEEFFSLLKKYNFALVMSDAGDKWPYFEKLTADFVYIRLHGNKKLYESGYPYQALASWKKKIENWRKKDKSVYVYFDNDAKVHAPFNAMYLLTKVTTFHPSCFSDKEILHH